MGGRKGRGRIPPPCTALNVNNNYSKMTYIGTGSAVVLVFTISS